MLLWLAITAFGIPLVYAVMDNKRRKQDLERQLERVQKQIAQKERVTEHGHNTKRMGEPDGTNE